MSRVVSPKTSTQRTSSKLQFTHLAAQSWIEKLFIEIGSRDLQERFGFFFANSALHDLDECRLEARSQSLQIELFLQGPLSLERALVAIATASWPRRNKLIERVAIDRRQSGCQIVAFGDAIHG